MDRLLREAARRPWLTYGAASTLPFAAFGLHRAAEALPLELPLPFTFYFPAVVLAAFLGGLRPGLVTAALSVGIVALSSPRAPLLGFVVLAATGAATSFASEMVRKSILTNADLRMAREQVLAVVAHDLRNPLQTVAVGARLLRQKAPPDMLKTVTLIERSATRMEHLIRDLLDAAKLDATGDLTMVMSDEDVRSIVAESMEAADNLARSKGLNIEASLPEGVSRLRLRCDRDRLLQVLENLLGNAIRFTPPGGEITLRVAESGGELRFEVADTGPGVLEAEIPHLFERHWRGRGSSGNGLGLYIAAGIVRAHGGRIWCHSEPGLGASFFVVLPAVTSNDAASAPPAEKSFRLS